MYLSKLCSALLPAVEQPAQARLAISLFVRTAKILEDFCTPQYRSGAADHPLGGLLTLANGDLLTVTDVWACVKDVLDRLLAGSTEYASLRPGKIGGK